MKKEEFIEKARKIHGDKYDYSKVVYTNNKTKVCIICPKHGEFWQTPNNHLRSNGCSKCFHEAVGKKCKKTNEQFKQEMINKYGEIYDFSRVNYVNNKVKVLVICKKHGEFYIRPNDLISGYGCPYCGHEKIKNKLSKNTEWFIEKARKIHGNKYDYSKVDYVNNHTKVCIICPEHGEFWQKPCHHLKNHGCPHCNESKLEKEVRGYLSTNNINFVSKKHFDWLQKQHLDFYLPEYNIAIECQGIQHFEPVDFSSKGKDNEYFKIVSERDKRKYDKCFSKNIKIIYYHKFKKYYGKYIIESHNEKELLNNILKHENTHYTKSV